LILLQRWVIFIGVEVYLLTAALYYVSQVPPFAGKIETTMRRDFDYKYRNVTNDSTLSSVYRWVQGSRIDHVQIYVRSNQFLIISSSNYTSLVR